MELIKEIKEIKEIESTSDAYSWRIKVLELIEKYHEKVVSHNEHKWIHILAKIYVPWQIRFKSVNGFVSKYARGISITKLPRKVTYGIIIKLEYVEVTNYMNYLWD